MYIAKIASIRKCNIRLHGNEKSPIIKYREFFNLSMRYISANNEHISVKVKVQHIKNHENYLLSRNVETGWLQIIPLSNTCRNQGSHTNVKKIP